MDMYISMLGCFAGVILYVYIYIYHVISKIKKIYSFNDDSFADAASTRISRNDADHGRKIEEIWRELTVLGRRMTRAENVIHEVCSDVYWHRITSHRKPAQDEPQRLSRRTRTNPEMIECATERLSGAHSILSGLVLVLLESLWGLSWAGLR